MPIDTSIYNALSRPRSVADYAADYDEQDLRQQRLQANALALQVGRQKSDEYGRGVREQEIVRNALAQQGSGATDEQRYGAMYGTGTGYGMAQAEALRKSMLDQQKTRSEAASKNSGLLKQYSTILTQSPTQATAMALLNHYETTTGERADEIRGILQQAGDNPDMLRKIAFALSTEGDKLLPKTEIRNLGGTDQAVTTDAFGGTTMGQSFAKTAGPDARLQAGTAAARLAFDREKLVDEVTQRSAPPKAMPDKPLPPAALKMQQESLDAIGISSSINADLGAVEKQITDGKLKFGPVSNLANAGLNMAGMSTEESRNFASFKSTLERLRNESLRLNTGVQTDGDAQRAWNELFQNINDTGLVQQRLAEIRNINKRGAELHKLRVDSVRGNYGAGPLDSSAYGAQQPALGGGAAPNAGPKPGDVEDGYRFKGGDKADPKNWERVK